MKKTHGVVTMLPLQKLSYLLNVILSLLVIHLANEYQNHSDTDTNYGLFQPPKEDSLIAKTKSRLSNQSEPWNVSLLCMVLTTPTNYKLKAVHVAATWGRRCSKLVFLSDHGSDHVSSGERWEILQIKGVGGREGLWDKVSSLPISRVLLHLSFIYQSSIV